MPRGDKTGPAGLGPMTGRGLGYCSGHGQPGYMTPGFGWGRGRGRGLGWGRGWGYPADFPLPSRYPVRPLTSFEEKEMLKEEKEVLSNELKALKEEMNAIEERIKEIGAKKK